MVAWSDDPALDAVVAANESPVLLVQAGTTLPEPDAPVIVDWAAGGDGEAAVVLGARLALARGTTLALRGDGGRRQSAAQSALEARGVRFAVPGDDPGPLAAAPLQVGPLDAAGPAVRVRAELDAAPVDFAAVPLAAEAAV